MCVFAQFFVCIYFLFWIMYIFGEKKSPFPFPFWVIIILTALQFTSVSNVEPLFQMLNIYIAFGFAPHFHSCGSWLPNAPFIRWRHYRNDSFIYSVQFCFINYQVVPNQILTSLVSRMEFILYIKYMSIKYFSTRFHRTPTKRFTNTFWCSINACYVSKYYF